MYTRLVSWSRYVFLAGIVLALVLVVPAAWFPFQLSKIAVFAACLALAALLYVVGGGARDLWRTHGLYPALLVGLLPLSYVGSYLFSLDRTVGLTGFSVETDTVLFTLVLALSYLLAFTYFRTLRTARMLMGVVFWSLAAAAVFQCISILFGSSVIPFQTFADRSVNLVGKWNDLGLMCAFLLLLVCVRVEFSVLSKTWRIGAAVAAALLVVLLAFINFPLAWELLLGGCVALGLIALLRHRQERGEGAQHMPRPWYVLAGAALSVLFLLYGGSINSSVTRVIPVSSLEVRPGLQSTFDVINTTRISLARTLLGTGPNTFGETWLVQKPSAVNQTPFWNLDFNVGYSTLATAFGTVGLLGALAWLIPLLLTLFAVVRVVRLGVLSLEERLVATMLALGSIFMLCTLALYVPSQNLIILAFVLSGGAFGFFSRQGRSAPDETAAPSMYAGISVLCLAAVLVVASVASGATVARRFVAEAYTGAGLQALAAGSADKALAYAESANRVEMTADGLRLAVDAGGTKLNDIAQDTTLKPDDARAAFTDRVQKTISFGQAAITMTPRDYRPYFSLGRVYNLLATLKVQGAYEGARNAYTAAAALNPTGPAIPLALARLEAAHGDMQALQSNLNRALTLKPDYTDAILFVVQVDVARNDLASAIRDTKTAVQTAPGVPSIWFELGLLYYAGGDTKNAVPVLEQALKLAPEYANARYFLGLSYYAEGRKDDAQKLFAQLAVSNPESAEVKAILANLAAGKKPLSGLAAPTAASSAPLSQ